MSDNFNLIGIQRAVKGTEIRNPPATDAQRASIIERVQQILTAESPPAPLSEGGSETDVPQLEAEIDRLVY